MNEPWHLLDGYFDGELTSDEQLQLRHWLAADLEHVRVFVKEAHLHHLLRRESMASATVRESEAELGSRVVTAPGGEASGTPIVAFPEPVEQQRRWKARAVFALAASITLLIGSVIWLFPRANDTPTLGLGPVAAVTIERGTETFAARDRMRLDPGDVVRLTGTNSVATINYAPESTRVEVHSGTELKLGSRSPGKRFELRAGTIEATVARQQPFKPMFIRTPEAEARVLGTKFTLTTATNRTQLDVAEGRVRLTRMSDGAAVNVSVGHSAIVAGGTELNALPQTGFILREVWIGIPGGEVNDLLEHPDYPGRPAHRDRLKSFETGTIETNNYACRLIGYIHPPVTGDYTFWIASGGYAALWLSPDENPVNKARIAAAFGGLPQQWDPPNPQGKFQMPQSPKVRLFAGQRYFIQAIQKTATGSSHLEVAWKISGAEREIISGEFLSPYKPKD